MSTPVATDKEDVAARPAATRDRLRGSMGRGALWLSVLTLLASGVNYASNLVFSRMLTPASFGDLSALLALSVLVGVPMTAAQTRVAERVASFSAAGQWDRVQYVVRHAAVHLATWGVAITGVYVLCIPLVKKLLDLQAIGPALALTPLIFVMVVLPVLQGALQGMERYVAFGVVALAIAVSRPLFGVPWVQAGGGSGGAIAGQAVGIAACLLGLLWVLRGYVRRTGSAAGWAAVRRKPDVAAVVAVSAFVFFAVIANCDVVFAKLFLTSHEAGEYAALATIGKIVTFLPAAIAVTVVPNAARAGASPRERAKVLRVAALLVTVAALVFAVPAALVPDWLVRVMFGEDYVAAADGVLPIVLAGTGLALLYLLVTFTVAIEDHGWAGLVALGVVLQATGIALFHSSPVDVAVVQAVTVAVVLLVNELRFHSLLRLPKEAT